MLKPFSISQTLPFDLDPTIPPPLSSPSISSPPLPPPPPPPPCHPPHRRPAPPGGLLPRPHQGGLLGSLLSPHPLPLGNRVSLRSSSPHFPAKDHSSESKLSIVSYYLNGIFVLFLVKCHISSEGKIRHLSFFFSTLTIYAITLYHSQLLQKCIPVKVFQNLDLKNTE